MELIKLVESWPEEAVKKDEEGILSFLSDPNTVLSRSWSAPTEELAYLVHKKGASLSHRAPFTGHTPMHAAARAGAEEQVRWFLLNGAPWNQVDRLGLVPAELALEEGHQKVYHIIFKAAVEQEWKRFYEPRKDVPDDGWLVDIDLDEPTARNQKYLKGKVMYGNPRHANPDINSFAMVDESGTGVMMEWERPIMQQTAALLCDGMGEGISCLNIGFGMGMIDTYFQSYGPAHHTIIEAHPDALAYMRQTGWYDKPNVRILEGRWQDFIHDGYPDGSASNRLTHGVGRFDVVYFDTYEEYYRGYLDFWKCVPGLLRGSGSRMSFFHGHGRRQPFVYRVFSEVARLHLNDLGLCTDWHDVTVDPKTVWYSYGEEQWKEEGKAGPSDTHPWQIPICMLAPTTPRKVFAGCGWASSDKVD